METPIKNFYTGTSGLQLPVPNKQFYPEAYRERSRLCYYASLMNTIEVNSSFYKIPQPATVKKWAAEVPGDFKFTFKLFRELTHNRGLAFDPALVSRFMQSANQVEGKKGCLLVQFPPGVRSGDFSQLRYLVEVLRESDPQMQWNMAFEFRHRSLYSDAVYDLLDAYGMGMVLHDKTPANTPFMETHPDFYYLRLHGPGGNYRGSYAEDVLYEYASYILDWLNEGKQVYVYFNNTMGAANENLNLLRQLVRATY